MAVPNIRIDQVQQVPVYQGEEQIDDLGEEQVSEAYLRHQNQVRRDYLGEKRDYQSEKYELKLLKRFGHALFWSGLIVLALSFFLAFPWFFGAALIILGFCLLAFATYKEHRLEAWKVEHHGLDEQEGGIKERVDPMAGAFNHPVPVEGEPYVNEGHQVPNEEHPGLVAEQN